MRDCLRSYLINSYLLYFKNWRGDKYYSIHYSINNIFSLNSLPIHEKTSKKRNEKKGGIKKHERND